MHAPNSLTLSGVYQFAETPPMSTYLVAFVVADFKNGMDGIVNTWAREPLVSNFTYGQKIAKQALDLFQKQLDMKYELPKMDLVAVPDFSAGAMENWGLITFRESNSIYDANQSPDAVQQRVASIVVHEVAHQWFGNLVTPEWWGDLWLSEAFARYFQYMATNKVRASLAFIARPSAVRVVPA